MAQKISHIQKKKVYDEYFDRFMTDVDEPAISQDGARMHIGANIEGEEEVEIAKSHGAEFIGLFRTELMFLEKGEIPTEDDHYAIYYEMLHRPHPMEVTIRVFDFGGDKEGGIHATGAMGLRGIRFCFLYPDVFLPQVRGLIRAATLGNLNVLIPFVSAVDEIREFKAILKEQAKDLKLEKNLKHIKVGAMIELPAALFIAEMLAKEVDFFSIGTNDLVQYLMAVERQDKALSQYFSHFHPAVLRALYNLSHIAKKYKIGLSVCGEMGGDPYFTLLFMGMGIHSLSMSPIAIPIVKKIVRSGYLEEGKALLNRLLMTTSEMELREILEREMEERYPNIFRKAWIDNIRKNGG
jgi:phosphotransferase system enzyme I (PtsI)